MKEIIKTTPLLVLLVLTGCSTAPHSKLTEVQDELNQAQEKNAQLQALNSAITNVIGSGLLPPNAKTGEYYARVLPPAIYRIDTKDVLKREVTYRIDVSHQTYEWETECALVKACRHLKVIPAVYEAQTEKVFAKASYTTWKKTELQFRKLTNQREKLCA